LIRLLNLKLGFSIFENNETLKNVLLFNSKLGECKQEIDEI